MQRVICSPLAISQNNWTHLTSTYDGSSLNLYINGSLAQSVTANGAVDIGAGPLQIGASYFGEYFQGLIDEVRIYSRALGATEVQQIYQQSVVSLPFDFSISNSGNKTVIAGFSTSNSINAALSSGNPQAVSFSVSGLPSGATGSFSSASCTPTCSTVLNISTTGSTPIGNFSVTINAAAGGITRSTAFTLTVSAPTVVSTVATPTITPNGGSFTNSVAVTLATVTSGSSIYYTTDGSAPTQSSKLYTGPMTLTTSAVIKAKAFKSGYNPSAEASASFTSDLVAYWKFDEGTGLTASDSSGNGNHGTLVNGPSWAAGITGKALSFDGIDDNVTVPDSSSLGLSNAFTLSAWVLPTAVQNRFTAVMSKNSSSDHTYFLYATSSDGYCGGTGDPLPV